MPAEELFASVITDTPGLGCLDYRVPEDVLLAAGDMVTVPLGKKQTAGIVTEVRGWTDVDRKKLRRVSVLKNGMPPLSEEWFSITRFAAHYYCRSWGEVALSAVPAFFRKKPGKRYEASLEKIRTLKVPEKNSDSAWKLLNAEQQSASDAVLSSEGFAPWVLFGITGSGKTEVYLNVIREVLARDPENQVLLLVPEINLTPQLETRVREHFPGEAVVSLHSELSETERARSWLAAHEGRARILVGTRLAALASFRKLALIVVDEEHDLSYKAGDGARYSARDLSVKRAQNLGIPLILGSATPSAETWMRVKKGAYRLLRLSRRAVETAELPSLRLVDMRNRKGEDLSEETSEAISAALSRGEQVLVFLNRRGFSPVLMCPACGWTSGCPDCSAFMVFHKDIRRMVCHHCGRTAAVPQRCPSCGAADILPVGLGTQKLEELVAKKWPEARLLRIDRDNFRTKKATDEAFRKVHSGDVDILIGTQMIAKGHDFKRVSLVVILNADTQLVSPDIRARERAFATMLQVSGRAGRSGLRSEVLIETQFPDDELFLYLAKQDYEGFADALLKSREQDMSPPFVFQALITSERAELKEALETLNALREKGLSLQKTLPDGGGVMLYDPVPMSLVKIAGKNRAQLLIEGESRAKLQHFLHALLPLIQETEGGSGVTLEVDPVRF